MGDKTPDEMIQELYQAVIGIPSNPDDNGLIGDVKEINTKLDKVNGRTRANEIRSKVNQSILGSGGLLGGVSKFLGWW